ncbi:hypothetical protein CHX26_11330 [Porphyrobacter sp. HT-58-2]|uniref:hypothetical protein n=1 Tax=Porphyrobacter sp. HT-58-2 TaxID=2023229 RepID=UPI000CDCD8A9|nr:hypothetical protein [Porphyrobacter sp. HT-58-2]AUX69999.1 hypothetical protein CHX26_11330 [Porphyrobacter sp. HT-58-2]
MMMLRTAGVFLVVMGIIWMLQGAGVLNWPANSFMLAQQQWVIFGALTALVGALLFWGAGRIRR